MIVILLFSYLKLIHLFIFFKSYIPMDEYNVLANKTRNYEQEYTDYIVKKFSKEIKQLENEISTYKNNTEEMSVDNNKKLFIEIEKLKKQKSELEENIRIMNENNKTLMDKNAELEGIIRKNNMILQNNEELKKNMINFDRDYSEKDEIIKKYEKEMSEALEENRKLKVTIDDMKKQIENLNESTKDKNDKEYFEMKFRKYIDEINMLRKEHMNKGETLDRISNCVKEIKNYIEKTKINELAIEMCELKKIIKRDVDTEKIVDNKKYIDQKDRIVLLNSLLEEKNKIIEKQNDELIKLRKQTTNPFGEFNVDNKIIDIEFDLNKFDQKSNFNNEKKPKIKEPVNKTGNEKLVSISKLISEENKSFFNNLSFTNSSPIAEKKFKKKK